MDTLTNDEVISTLNNLIETCKDGQNGFQEAASAATSSDLKTLFSKYSQQRAQFAGELQGEVRNLGGDPETTGSLVASLHRGWIDVKAAITGKDDAAIVNEAERGEDSAKKNYEEAIKQPLPANLAEVVQRQYTDVKAAHDKIRDMKHANQANSANS